MLSDREASTSTALTNWSPWMLRCCSAWHVHGGFSWY